MRYASCVLRLPVDRPFTYSIPARLADEVTPGKRIWVPFGKRRMVGYVVDTADRSDVEGVRPLESVIDKEPLVSAELLSLARWISEYYMCSWGEAIDAAIPGVLKSGKTRVRARKAEAESVYETSTDLVLTGEQKAALDTIAGSLDKKTFSVFLLHGVTASGKTEVYLRAIRHALKEGRSSIVLVPEISLTPQTVERFKSRFGDEVAVMHSGLLGSTRSSEYEKIRSGRARVVVGARSAVFAPVKDLALIVLDEEHETSYKQENVPRYHAREAAIERARIAGAVVMLGSATPSLESYYRAKAGDYRLLELTKRIKDIALPKVNIVDMRKELYLKHHATVFSRPLKERLLKVISSGQQAILFLNRRGFSTFVYCRKCGQAVRCARCDAVMVYHFSQKKLVCHYCSGTAEPREICPTCRGAYVKYFGMGTERVESELHRYFPEGRIDRMDRDTTSKRGSHERLLGSFRRHDTNILVGTQMIAKGLDFPKVTLVGVVSADTTLNLPDFRAAERTFNLLTQVAGRAGRGDEGGEVIIQTYTPEHYAITAASRHDYHGFYATELASRRDLGLPPFVNIVRITLKGRKEEIVAKQAKALSNTIKKKMKDLEILGPAPAVVSKVRNQYLWNIILKTKEPRDLAIWLKSMLGKMKRRRGVSVSADVDPVSV